MQLRHLRWRPELNLMKMLRPGIGQLGTHPPKPLLLPANERRGNESALSFPRISIVVPSLNQGRFIGETLKSIVEQNYPNLELIVVDGGSSDNSLPVITEFEAHIAWCVSEPDSGQAAAINKGFRRSTGEIMAWINSDDRVAPGTLYRVADHFQKQPETKVLYGNRILIDEESHEIGRWILPAHSERVLKWADFVPQETLYWRRSAWDAVGCNINEDFQFAMDWDLLLRFSAQQQKIERVPSFLGVFRVHQAQKTTKDIASIGENEMHQLRRRTLGFVPSRRQVMLNTVPYVLAAKFHELNYDFALFPHINA